MPDLRRARTLLSALVLLSAQATPVFAVGADAAALGAANCAPGEAGIVARGGITDSKGVIREMETGQEVVDLPPSAKGRAPADLAVTVPVWFHVITDSNLGFLSARDLDRQICVLNVTFGGGEGGDDSGFSFVLAGVDYTDNAKWYWMKGAGVEHEMKKALKRGGDDTLNVYTNTAGVYLGWAYLPSITESRQAYLDGVVLDWESLPGVSERYADQYDEGETLTHEVDHWLNLEHTFFNGCREPGDFVDDTPAQATPTSGCPEGKDTCTAPGVDPIHNYMDYSFDDCYTEFTGGQSQRMRDAWLFYRAS